MPKPSPQPPARRKFSRQQIQQILKKNFELYKDEQNFIPYMVELTLYLMEFEYDWSESEACGPRRREQILEGASADATPPHKGHAMSKSLESESSLPCLCLHCGQKIAHDDFICPNCANLTH